VLFSLIEHERTFQQIYSTHVIVEARILVKHRIYASKLRYQTVLIEVRKAAIRISFLDFTIHCCESLIFHEMTGKVNVRRMKIHGQIIEKRINLVTHSCNSLCFLFSI
jgi:hypothetical protein